MIEPRTRGLIGPQLSVSNRHLNLGDQLRAFAKLVDKRINVVHKEISIKMFTTVVLATPVATGLARGNWQASMGMPKLGEINRIDPTGSAAIRDIESSIKADRDMVAYLANNLPYIIPLEYGHSKQQPEGMVRITVANFRRIVSETVAANRSVR